MSALSRLAACLAIATGCLLFLPACRNVPDGPAEPSPTAVSLLDQQLLDVIEKEARLDEAAAQPDAYTSDIQRLFHQVARDYEGIITRNPRHLESRLLYGKLLSRYGDREGARLQFLSAAQIDPDVAVIHQQLSKYYAEDNDHTRALAYALNAVRIEPETAAYHFALGELLTAFRDAFISDGVFTQAQLDEDLLNAFDQARQLEPDSLPLQFRFGEAFYDVASPDWQRALQHWKALCQRPDLSPTQLDAARVHQARCLSELGLPDQAKALLDQVRSSALPKSLIPPS